MIRVDIPIKLPSFNDYISECRKNKFAGAKMKKQYEDQILFFLGRLKKLKSPVRIVFIWVEDNKRRDYDNVAFAKKFILDAMVKGGYLEDDNRKCVTGFTDRFAYAKKAKVILLIEEDVNDQILFDNSVPS